MKVLWIDISSSYSHSSLSLPSIEAQHRVHSIDIEWSVVRGTLKSDISLIVSQCVAQQPDLIAYTSWLFNCNILSEVLSRLKSLLPKVMVIGGGPEYMGNNEEFLRTNRYVDYLLRGEGEEAFYSIINSIGNPNISVEGLCYIDNNGDYIDMGRAVVKDISQLLPPEESRFFDWSKPFVQLETTRGCFNNCAFCVSGDDKPIRSQGMAFVAKRVNNIFDKGIRDIRVLDRTFNHNPKRAMEMIDIFSQYPQMRFHIELHPALLTQQLKNRIALLPKDLLHIEAGVQSLDDRVLVGALRRGESRQACEGLRFLCSLDNLETHTDLIAGLPHYTLAQIYSDVRELAEIGACEIQLESLKLLPGTYMRDNSEALGLKYSPKPPYEVLESREMSYEDLRDAMVLSKLVDTYYNNPSWHSLFRSYLMRKLDFAQRLVAKALNDDLYSAPMSQERQGQVLFDFLESLYPELSVELSIQWIKNGLSLKKSPARGISSQPLEANVTRKIIDGEWDEGMRIYHFTHNHIRYIFGFNRAKEHSKPVYTALEEVK